MELFVRLAARSTRSEPPPRRIHEEETLTAVYRCMRGDGEDLLVPALSQDISPSDVTSTLSLGMRVQHGGDFRGSWSNDPVVRFKQKAMHAIGFGSNYTSPFLHTTKSFAVAVSKLNSSRDRDAYLVKIDLVGLSGSQPDAADQPVAAVSGSQPVVVDVSTKKHQEAGGAIVCSRAWRG